MLELLLMSILGAAALGSQRPDPSEADSEAMARILLGLDYKVTFTYTDFGEIFRRSGGGEPLNLWDLEEIDAQCLMHEARKKAGWYSAEGEEIFPDGSELDDGTKVTVEITGRIGIGTSLRGDIYTYDIVLTVPQEARYLDPES